MKKFICFLLPAILIHLFVLAGDDKSFASAILKSATVYRVGAELTHSAKVNLRQGNNEVIIEGLSNGLDINSVQIGCDDKITIMSVEFSTEYLKPATVSTGIRKLQDSLEIINREKNKIQVIIKTDFELLELLKANREIKGSQAGLTVTELTKMVDYYKNKSLEVQNEITSSQAKESSLNDITQKIKQQIAEEEQKNNKTIGKLMLQVLSPLAGNHNLTISYFTAKASWNPSYDLRVESISKPIMLLYKAKLVQTTGIDWQQVKLTLATAIPNQKSNAPVLRSWFLSYIDPVTRMENNLYMNSIQSSLQGRAAGLAINNPLSEVVVVGYGTNNKDDEDKLKIRGISSLNSQPVYVINGNITSRQDFEKIDPKNIKKVEVLKAANATSVYGDQAAAGAIVVTLKEDISDYITISDNELNVSFDIELPYDVPGNGKEQAVALKEFTVNALYKYYSVPKLDKDAYLLGEIAEWEKLNLLPGEANIIFEGTYTGKTFIDPNSTMDTLNLTLGRDKRIVVKKEKLKDFSSTKFLGSNKKQVFTYEITVKNNKKESTLMLLKDQYPLSTNKDIEVELMETSDAANNTELGVLTWKLQLGAGETKKVRVSYSVKYPKDKFVNLTQ